MKHHILLLLIFIMFAGSGCTPVRYSETRLSISGESSIPVSMILYAHRKPDWDEIFAVLKTKAGLYDHRIKGSPIYILNSESRATVPEDVYRVISLGMEVAEQSNGAFDPTILPLTQLWNFDQDPRLPPDDAIKSALDFVDYTRIKLPGNNTIELPRKFGLDLGGIAKGAIVDEIADYLVSRGYEQFLIEAGGDILVSGIKPSNRKWGIGIIHPRDKNTFLGELSLGKETEKIAVVTSGDYERFFEENGKRYHHILNPHTGYPAEEIIAVTVIAPTCAEADALATAVFVLGKEEGLMLLEEREGADGLIVYERDNILNMVMTDRFSTMFKPRSAS